MSKEESLDTIHLDDTNVRAQSIGSLLAAPLLLLLLVACGGGGGGPTPPSVKAPTNLKATAADGSVTLTWSASTTGDLAGYGIYQGTDHDELSRVDEVDGSTLTFTATGLTNGTTYFFAVDAKTEGGALSARSDVASATPSPSGVSVPPVVVSTSPEDGASDVGTNSNINVTFTTPMAQAETEGAFGSTPELTCDFSWDPSGNRLTCTPQSGLAADQHYLITIDTTAKAADGTPFVDAATFGFTTGATATPLCTFGSTEFGACVFGE